MGDIKDSGQKISGVTEGYWRQEDANGYEVLYDGTVHRLIIGLLPDGTIGMVISKEGVDVFDVFD